MNALYLSRKWVAEIFQILKSFCVVQFYNIGQMFKYAILALLFVATLQSAYLLSPIYPPTAFEGQFYEVRFRVRGLDYPNFSFKGLPSSFQGSADGVVSGIARGSGSYSVIITYSSGAQKGQSEVVLRVTPALQSTSTFQSATVINSADFSIGYPKTLVYTVGSSIQLQLEAYHGYAPLLWRYINLPSGLYGDQQGIIKGSFANSGYYSFNVECSDSKGISTQAYLTLNIQPKSAVRTTQVVQVQNKHVPLIYDIVQVEKEQVQADNELFNALDLVDKKKSFVNAKKQVVAVATLAVQKATGSLEIANSEYNVALGAHKVALERVRVAENALKAAQENLNLALIEQGNAQKTVVAAQKAVSDAQNRFAQASKDVSIAEDKLVAAKDAMKTCEQNLRTAKAQRQAAKNEFARAFADLEDAKQDLELAKRRKQIADLTVSAARDTLDIITQARDDAIAALNIAEFALKQAELQLAKILDKLSYIRSLYADAKIAYGTAKWDYEQALNKLYVAQARKESADRASAIALAEGSRSDHNLVGGNPVTVGSSGNIFGGCESKNYPPISGTVKITEKLATGYRVSTGHQILYGACTSKVDCKIGDTIAYNGYIVNGVINAKRIERVLLS